MKAMNHELWWICLEYNRNWTESGDLQGAHNYNEGGDVCDFEGTNRIACPIQVNTVINASFIMFRMIK
jgi:hypothetical protein